MRTPAIPPDAIIIDDERALVFFGDDTPQGADFHRVANFCRDAAEQAGVGPSDLANVLIQLAAYFIGTEYDDANRRAFLARELIKAFLAKADRAVAEAADTGFRLSGGTIDTAAGRYAGPAGETRYMAGSPLVDFYALLGGDLRQHARASGMPPVDLAGHLMTTAGYHVGSTHPDADQRRAWTSALSTAFAAKLRESPELGRQDRAKASDLPPIAGWRGGTELNEEDNRRGHPLRPWLA
jgi:hypothetical protein